MISPAPRDAWKSVLASDPDALPSHSPQWTDAICDGTAWRDASRLYVTQSGRRIVLPLTEFGIGPMAGLVSPVRGWGYGGIIADGGVTADDIALVSDSLSSLSKLCFRIRPNPLQARLYENFVPAMNRVPKVSHVVDLAGGADVVRSRFRSSANKGIRTAEKAGIRIETAAGGALLPEFFGIAVKARAFWAGRQHEPVWLAQLRGRFRDSQEKWNRIARHLGSELQVSVAWHGERPVAAGIVLQARNAHGTRAALDPEHRCVGASHLLNWVVLQNACKAGARWFHMGESATPGAAAFKEFLGAKPYDFAEIELERVPLWRGIRLMREAAKRVIGFREGAPLADGKPNQPRERAQ